MYHKWELERGQNTFISLKVREMNATAQEGIEPLPHTYIVENTKGNDYCMSRLSAITNIVIFTPLAQEVEKMLNEP